ncbi:MAG: protein of unknown function with transrane region [Candidatus Taylorbacteria bacterium]|nr:protein of unknown function with transrane region [Candidatus Taylorbacteria bacterium]
MNGQLRWSGFEFEYKEKTADWFWAVSIIVISIAVIAYIYDNTIFGMFILLAGLTSLSLAKRPPQLFDYELNKEGLLINKKLYPHIDFKTFFVLESKYHAPKLILRTNRLINPIMVITIETDYVDAVAVRDFLLDYIPEEKMEEPLSIRFMEFLGF